MKKISRFQSTKLIKHFANSRISGFAHRYDIVKTRTPIAYRGFNQVQKITEAADAAVFLRSIWPHPLDVSECFVALALDRSNTIIGWTMISKGGVFNCIVDIRLTAFFAVQSLASSVILAHNHPSGQLKASDADVDITRKVKEALAFFDITVLDHVILTPDSCLSFTSHGIM